MNIYGVCVLIALLADYGLHTASDALNLKALNGKVPESVASLYGPEGLDRAKRYVSAVTTDAMIERSIGLVILFAFWLLGGFNWLDLVVRQVTAGEVVRGLVFLGSLALGQTLVGLPFDVHRTFVTESRFGFNRTTWQTFVADRVKGLALMAAIGGTLLSGVLWLFMQAGDSAWLLCWLIVVAFMLVVQWLGPAVILPLFNRFDPMPNGELRDAIVRYAESVGFPLQNVYLIDGSRRSSKANAFFTGIGSRRRIALFDTLVNQHSTDEIVSILAHEVGHYQLKHVVKGLLIGALHAGVAFLLLQLFLGRPGLYDAFFLSRPSLYAGFACFLLLYTPVEMVLSVIANLVSRRHEFAADRFAVDTAPSPGTLPDALKTLSVSSLAHPNSHPFHVFLNYSHPPLAQRLDAIEERLADEVAW